MFESIKVWVYGIVAVAALGASSLGGYKVGEWKQASADHDDVKTAQDALTQNAVDVAAAEKAARAETAAIYEKEIKDLKAKNEWANQLDADLQKTNATLATKLYNAQQAVRTASHVPTTQALLDTPLPADLRDSVRNAINGNQAGVPSGADHRPH